MRFNLSAVSLAGLLVVLGQYYSDKNKFVGSYRIALRKHAAYEAIGLAGFTLHTRFLCVAGACRRGCQASAGSSSKTTRVRSSAL